MKKIASRDLPSWPRLLSVSLAAAYLGLSETTFLALKVTERKIGARRLWAKEDLDAFVDTLGRERNDGGTNPWLGLFDDGDAPTQARKQGPSERSNLLLSPPNRDSAQGRARNTRVRVRTGSAQQTP